MPKKSSTVSSRRHWSSISEQSSDETPTGLTKTVHRVGLATDDRGFELMEQLVGKLRAAGHEVPVRSPSRRSPTSTPTFCPSTAWTRRKSFIRESHLCVLLKEQWPSLPWLFWRSAGCGSEVEHPHPPGGGGHPTPEEFQALRHEVADLKHKLEERETRNPKESSGSIDSQP